MLLNETALAEIEERANLAVDAMEDPEVQARYAKRAGEVDVPQLVQSLREAYAASGGGGDLGMLLRNALKARILKGSATLGDANKRIATMADDVKIHSLSVSSVAGQGRVVVDIRMMVGDEPVVV